VYRISYTTAAEAVSVAGDALTTAVSTLRVLVPTDVTVRTVAVQRYCRHYTPTRRRYTKQLIIMPWSQLRFDFDSTAVRLLINQSSISLIATLRPESRIANDMQLK